MPWRYVVLWFSLFAGCNRALPQVAPPEQPVVPISQPVQREVTDYVDFTGRTDAVQSVDLRARVTGYLTKIDFKEGTEVKEGAVLFEIDPRPYAAQLKQAESMVNLYKAQLKLATTTYERDKAIARVGGGNVSQQELDQDRAAVEQAEASVKANEASVEVYRLNLEYTKVTAPINGKISRYYITPGNLVVQDQTVLTTLVSLDPMYAYFDMDEATLLNIKAAINAGKIKKAESNTIPVLMQLHGEEGYPHKGTIDFVNNQVNAATGSITIRGVFANPEPANGTRVMTPGMFVRIRLPIGQPHQALLIIDRAIGSDQGLKFVYVVDSNNTVQYRRVSTGPLQNDGLRVITEGLKPDDWVVVGAILQIRPHQKVETERVGMPTLSGPTPGTPPAEKTKR
jgi:membrane fusion protein, multidrug efflux system